MVEIAGEGEQLGCVLMMGVDSLPCGGRLDRRQIDGTWGRSERAIDKQDGVSAGDVFGQLGSPLMVGEDAHAGLVSKAPFGPLGKPKPDAVIGAQRVAAGEDEASG